MSKNEAELIRVSRLLTPEHRAALRDWVCLASAAENSARKSLEFGALFDGTTSLKSRESSCENSLKRSRK